MTDDQRHCNGIVQITSFRYEPCRRSATQQVGEQWFCARHAAGERRSLEASKRRSEKLYAEVEFKKAQQNLASVALAWRDNPTLENEAWLRTVVDDYRIALKRWGAVR